MNKLYRISQLVDRLNISKSTIYLWVSEGKFPPSFKIGDGTSVWHEGAINSWIESKEKEVA